MPGGLIGVGLKVDPFLTRADRLVGQIIGHPGKMPDVVLEIEAQYYLLRRLLGVKSEGDKNKQKVSKLKLDEILMINIGSTSLGGKVISFNSVRHFTLSDSFIGKGEDSVHEPSVRQ